MSDSEIHNAQANAGPAAGQAAAPKPSIQVIAHMWITWAELAIEHDRESRIERNAMMGEYAKGGNFAVILGRETAEAVLAICSASFAMDALIGAWARLVMDPTIVAKWESPRAKSPMLASRTLEVLKRSVGASASADSLAQQWKLVFDRRNDVVHYAEQPGSLVPHPAGIGRTAEVNATYCQENATAAVDLLMTTLDVVASAAKSKLAKWLNDFSPTLRQLREKKNADLQLD